MRKYLLLLAAAALLAAPRPAAAFVATSGERLLNNGAPTGLGDLALTSGATGNVANAFIIDNTGNPGDFVTYNRTEMNDPWLVGNDLSRYHYLLGASVNTITGNTGTYTGTYTVFYDGNDDGLYGSGDNRVTAGTIDLTGTFDPSGNAALTGGMTQTLGPDDPTFADWGAIYQQPVSVVGHFMNSEPGRAGRLSLTLNGTTAVPEPGSFALLASGLLPLLGLRRRK